MEPYVSDNVLNGAQRLNDLNGLNGSIPMMTGVYKEGTLV